MAQRFAELLFSWSRRSIVARALVGSCSPVRPTSHASTIARELRSPVQSIASKRTASIRDSGFPEPRSDSSGRYEPPSGWAMTASGSFTSFPHPGVCPRFDDDGDAVVAAIDEPVEWHWLVH